jgi:hypothetical protein
MWVAADTSDISGTVRLETGGPAPLGSRVLGVDVLVGR